MQPCIPKKYCFLKINYCFSIINIYLHQTNYQNETTFSTKNNYQYIICPCSNTGNIWPALYFNDSYNARQDSVFP